MPARRSTPLPQTLLLIVLLAGCGKETADTPRAPGDSATPPEATTISDSSSMSTTVTRRDSSEPFETRVFRDYASQGVAIPRSVTDSIAGLKDIRKMEVAMNNYMRRHDSLVRSTIAAHYGLSLDSLDAIIRSMDTTRSTRDN